MLLDTRSAIPQISQSRQKRHLVQTRTIAQLSMQSKDPKSGISLRYLPTTEQLGQNNGFLHRTDNQEDAKTSSKNLEKSWLNSTKNTRSISENMGCFFRKTLYFFQKTLCFWKKTLCFQMKLKSNEILAPSFENVLTFEAMRFGTQTDQMTLTDQRRSATRIRKIGSLLGESQRSSIYRPLGSGAPAWAASKIAWRESWKGFLLSPA